MSVRSCVVVRPHTLPATPTAQYTVPAGTTTLVKHVTLVNQTSGTRVLQVHIGAAGAAAAANNMVMNRTVVGAQDLQLPVWWALEPGDVLYTSYLTGTMVAGFYGAELAGVAP